MSPRVYGMDTGFSNSLGAYDFDVRCEMLAELGYDAINLTLWSEPAWADLPRLAAVRSRHGLDVACVYATVDVGAPADDPGTLRTLRMIESLEGCSTVELAVDNRAPGEPDATHFLGRAIRAAERHGGVRLLLYPHYSFWLGQVDQAVRLCDTMRHPSLGLTFTLFHWYAAGGGDLGRALTLAAPYLHQVNLSGSRRQTGGYFPATIEPLDSGELDLFAVLGALASVGFDGWLGVQAYGVGGDAYANFRRSLAALRDMHARLATHPHWARLRSDPI